MLIHLHELPLSVPALPLLMVYRGPREREIAEFVLEHGQEYQFFAEQAITFHPRAIQEVLTMKGMNVEAYRQLANVKDIVELIGSRILIEEMGTKEIIRTIGEDEVIRTIGEDQVIRVIGEERLRQLLDQMAQNREKQEADTDSS